MSEHPQPAFGVGSICWHELYSKEIDKTKAFYTKVLGWSYEAWGDGSYSMIKAGDNYVGGVMDINKPEFGGMHGAWGYCVDVANVDETAARVEKLGGKLINPPTDVPGIGRMAQLIEPSGSMFSVITLTEHATEHKPTQTGQFLWVELLTRDAAKATAFLGELLNWKAQEVDMPGGKYTLLFSEGRSASGMMPMPPQVPAEVPSHWVGYISVPDVDATAKFIEAAGGQILFPPMDVPGIGRFTQFLDPTGATAAIMTPAK